MIIGFHKNFRKKYKKLNKKTKEKLKDRLDIFLNDQYDPILENHPLKGKYADFRSINITGDFRAIYKYKSNEKCIFVDVDTHSNLFG